MSYNFYSLVTSIKDKSSQAMATLSSDLKEFTSIVQEDVAEVAKTVRKTVHEQSEALRQRVEEQQQQEDGDAPREDSDSDNDDAKPTPHATPKEEDGEAQSRRGSLFSFAGLSLEAVGSKILQSADGLLDTLARAGAVEGEVEEYEEEETAEDKLASARRYRLLALQEDAHTYVHPPMDVETFKKWRKALPDDEFQSIQDEVLAHYPTVAEKLAELVPASVSAEDFWAHYIYKASLLAAQEQRGADLLEHALNDSEEEVGWDVDSPRNGDDHDGRFPTYEDNHDAVPILEDDAPEPSSPAPVLGEQRPGTPDSDVDSPTPLDSISSDGESWTELDDQRRETQQPPLSSSSTSSFVPVYVPNDGVYSVVGSDATKAGVPSRVKEDDEEDVDWGDDEESETPSGITKVSSSGSAAVIETPETKARGPDWGEWD